MAYPQRRRPAHWNRPHAAELSTPHIHRGYARIVPDRPDPGCPEQLHEARAAGIVFCICGATYAESPRADVAVVRANEAIVGASTCIPPVDEKENVKAPFVARGWDPARFFYYGEALLKRELRGRGIGVAFIAAVKRMPRRCLTVTLPYSAAWFARPTIRPARRTMCLSMATGLGAASPVGPTSSAGWRGKKWARTGNRSMNWCSG